MKVVCPISGIQYTLTNPLRGHTVHPHPMLASSITCANLADWYLADWTKGDLPQVETHLLGCAYLLKLPVESIGLPVMDYDKLAKWDGFWSSSLEKLAKIATKLEGKGKVFKSLPRLVVTLDTISALPEWLKDLENEIAYASQPISDKAKELNKASYKSNTEATNNPSKYLAEDQIDQVVRRALTGSPLTSNETKALPVILSDWALKVTQFPETHKMRFQRIIITIFNPDYINMLLMSDIKLDQVKALEEHLMLNTPEHAVGTSHSSILMKRLEAVIPVLEDFSPSISSRKKSNTDDLINGLGGSSSPAPKKVAGGMSLSERLAARLASIQGAKK